MRNSHYAGVKAATPCLLAFIAGATITSQVDSSNSEALPLQKVIPGRPADAQLIANYPAASYRGFRATTSDLGPERSDGMRWLILNPPIPAGAAAAGFSKLLYAFHPVVGDINLSGSPKPGSYFVSGSPGTKAGDDPARYATIKGQLALKNPGNKTYDSGNLMAAQTYHNDRSYEDTIPNDGLTPLSASSGYYIESATTTTVNDGNNWSSFWIWTYEGMTSNEVQPWVELDINEWGFNQRKTRGGYGGSCGSRCGTLTSLIYWAGTGQRKGLAQLRSSKNLDMTRELVIGAAWDPSKSKVEVWENGAEIGMIAFADASIPPSAWQGKHHFPLFGANSHGYTATPAFNYELRYVMAWGPQ